MIDIIRNSIVNNKQEIVIVDDEYMPEITEVYVALVYRKKELQVK